MRSFQHIAKLIRSRRQEHPKGYSQSELSHLLGYKNGQFISNVERALCSIPLKMLKKISEVLDIEQTELKRALMADYESTLDAHLKQGKTSTTKTAAVTAETDSEPVSCSGEASASSSFIR